MKRKKIGYQYGMLSMIGICLALLWYKHYTLNEKKEVFFQIQMPYPELDYSVQSKCNRFSFKEGFLLDSINYVTLKLTGNNSEDSIVLAYADLLAKELVSSQSEKDGIKLLFSNQSKFWTLIEALDICNRNNVKIYAFVDDAIWLKNTKLKFENNYMALPTEKISCGTGEINAQLEEIRSIENWNRFFKENTIALIICLFILIGIIIKVIKRIAKQLLC